jgi:hypothetical protein
MTSRRVILPALVLSLAFAAPAWATSSTGGIGRPVEQSSSSSSVDGASSGGATANPMRSGPGGGAPAPAGVVDDAQSAAQPRAGAAQEPTPTTPEGGPQSPEPDVPTDDGDDQTSTDDGGAGELPSDQTGAEGNEGASAGSSGFGFLPHTGLGLAALATLGLALLLGGAALLRPTRARRAKVLH